MEVSPEYASIGDEAMHDSLLGNSTSGDTPRYIADILLHPKSAWIVDVAVPDQADIYGPASGRTLPVATFIAYPSVARSEPGTYAFPYNDAQYGVFEDMLAAGETPSFDDPETQYPLIVLAHGASAHGIYDVRHAHALASHGYIVAVPTFGDDRTGYPDNPNHHVSFLRPLLTKAVIDSLLDSETFGPHIDGDNIGISGHSFGGFTVFYLSNLRFPEFSHFLDSTPNLLALLLDQ